MAHVYVIHSLLKLTIAPAHLVFGHDHIDSKQVSGESAILVQSNLTAKHINTIQLYKVVVVSVKIPALCKTPITFCSLYILDTRT